MQDKIITRMGDGARIELSAEHVKEDILAGTQDAADRGKIPQLNPDELEQLFEIFADTNRIVSVKPGEEVITTDDAASMTLIGDQADGGVALPLSSLQSVLTYERVCCADTAGIGHTDYSCKPVKPIINHEKQKYYSLNQAATIPLIYGMQPNLGQYFQPDGPFPNPSELLNYCLPEKLTRPGRPRKRPLSSSETILSSSPAICMKWDATGLTLIPPLPPGMRIFSPPWRPSGS